MRRLPLLVVVVATVLLTGGCFRYQSAVVVQDDGSGVAQEALLVDREALATLFADDAALDEHIPRAATFSLPPWISARDHRDGRFEGVVMDIAFDTPQQLNERLDAVHDLLADTTGSRATSNVELTRTDNGWQFEMQTMNLAEIPDLPGAGSARLGQLYHGGQLVVALRLPGRLVDHNADEVADGQLVWRLSAQAVQTQLYARTSTGGPLVATAQQSRARQIATAAATLGGLITFAAVAFSRRRRPTGGAPAGSTQPAGTRPGGRPLAEHDGATAWPAVPPARPPQPPPGPGAEPPSPPLRPHSG